MNLLLAFLLLLASADPIAILGDTVHLAVTSPDRQVVAFWSDGEIRVWDLQTGREMWQWAPHGSPVWLAIAPDKSTLLMGESEQRVAAWSLDGHHRWSTPWEGSRPLIISPRSQHAVGRSGDGFSARIYDMASGTFRRAVTGHSLLQAWSYAPDGRLFLGWGDSVLQVCSSDGSKTLQQMRLSGPARAIVFSPTDETVAVAAGPATLLLDAHTLKLQQRFAEPDWTMTPLAFSPAGNRFAIEQFKAPIRYRLTLRELPSGRIMHDEEHQEPSTVDFSLDNHYWLVNGESPRMYRLVDADPTWRSPQPDTRTGWFIPGLPQRVLLWGQDDSLKLWGW